jgi:ribokinase
VSRTTFVAVGDVMVDVAAAGSGHAAAIEVSAGGSAVNAAVAATASGADATVIGRVGNDLGGRALRAALEDRGVRAELSVDADARTGTFLVVDGQIRADRGANARFEPAHLPELEADVVLVSGYLPAETVAAAVERATATWVALVPGLLDPLPDGADAVLVNDIEARRLTGLGAREAAVALGRTFRLACVTRGRAGALAVLDGSLESSTPEPVDGAGGVGAGDAFAASLLVALARGDGLRNALAAASRAGAAVASGAAR